MSKLFSIAFLAFVSGSVFAQDDNYVVKLSESESVELEQLSPGQAAYAKFLLKQQPIPVLKAESNEGEIGILPAYEIMNSNRSSGDERFSSGRPAEKIWGISIDQVIDERSAIANDWRWWIEGWDTSKWNDGETHRDGLVNCVAEVGESKTYETSIGSRKVRRYIRVDCEPALKLVSEIVAKDDFRLWTAGSGEFQIAKFLRANKTHVSLKLPDKKTVKVEIKLLSQADQDWIEANK